ncbi:aurora kinase 2 splicing [Colletotrichum tabaci]|uniref:Aurora kinase 2 splicing n=2 Tax=Colletotrichum tabaci TaxID=1209068 RepID=A0AAV9TCG7_9PEZI
MVKTAFNAYDNTNNRLYLSQILMALWSNAGKSKSNLRYLAWENVNNDPVTDALEGARDFLDLGENDDFVLDRQDPTYEDTKNLNKRLKWQMESLDRGLTFVPLDLPTAKLFVFVDGSFANNRDMTSQLGFIIILGNEEPIDGHDDAFKLTGNVVHYSSTKSKRVTRSVLASEIYGMVAGVDMAYAILSTLAMITKKLNLPIIPTIACTDSYSLCECLVKLGTTQEKRQMIDIMALRQSYERRELYEVRWINGDDNLADALTKATPNQALENFITTSSAQIRMEGWVARA